MPQRTNKFCFNKGFVEGSENFLVNWTCSLTSFLKVRNILSERHSPFPSSYCTKFRIFLAKKNCNCLTWKFTKLSTNPCFQIVAMLTLIVDFSQVQIWEIFQSLSGQNSCSVLNPNLYCSLSKTSILQSIRTLESWWFWISGNIFPFITKY